MSSLFPGARIGSFEVVALIGAGGMGEVYRARDTRLNREVALKVLPEAFNLDSDRHTRFEREAQLLAALNHPHIATIHGIDETGGRLTLVMELVDGPTLADMLASGSRLQAPGVPAQGEEALAIARQICEGLEYAHERGVVHRDLKPANIKWTQDHGVKILDFGLAKALDDSPAMPDRTQSPTLSAAATRQGMILGTAAYMSPEQARGHAVDRRADIWAFGCVLFEMLTGKQAFGGDTISDTLAAVLRAEPQWSSLPATTSMAVRRLVRRCLEKDPKRRLQHIGDARLELDEASSDSVVALSATSSPAPSRGWSQALRLSLAAAAGAVVVGIAAWVLAPRPAPARVDRFTIPVPASAPISSTGVFADVALSSDGRTLVYVAGDPGSRSSGLFKRQLDGLRFELIRGTEDGAVSPFFSPDGAWIGFFAAGKLKKVPRDGGLAVPICDAPLRSRATWGDDGSIVVANRDLYEVDSGGLKLILKSDNEGFYQPRFIPGSKTLLVSRGPNGARRIEAVDLQSRTLHPLLEGTNPQLAANGDLLFERQGGVWAARFDTKRLALLGSPVQVVESVRLGTQGAFQGAAFTAARDGSIAYIAGNSRADGSMVWIDRAGNTTPAIEARGGFQSPRLSPDGKRVVVSSLDGGRLDLWAYEFERGTRLRLTTRGSNRRTAWSPDGTRIAFYATPEGEDDQDLFVMPSTGGPPTRLLTRPNPQYPDTWSADGLVFEEVLSGGRDLWFLPPGGTPRPLLVTRFNERGAVFSPDGRWLAFVSDESGRPEVYVIPFPGPGPKVPISTNGGAQPMWARDGHELFYREGDELTAAAIQLAPFHVMGTRKLFELPSATYNLDPNFADYDVAPDGRFLAIRRDSAATDEIHVVLNWTEELRRALKR